MQGGGTGLVFGQRGVSAGIIGLGGRPASGDPLWSRTARDAGGNRPWIVAGGNGSLGLGQGGFAPREQRDERKVGIAMRLRKETTMSLKWIAEQLEMGSWTYVSELLVAKR